MSMDDIFEVFNNIIIGSLFFGGMVLFIIIGVLINLYASWLHLIWFGAFLIVSYEIGRHIRKK